MNMENRVFLLCSMPFKTAVPLAGDPSPVHAEADVCSDFG